MNILGFAFSKISVEKLEGKAEQLKINSGINVKDIKVSDAGLLKTKDEILELKFNHTINYDPDYAKIEFEGTMFVSLEPKLSKEVLKDWKNKKLKDDFKVFVFNIILKKSSVKALELEDEMNLPLHIPLPSVKANPESSK